MRRRDLDAKNIAIILFGSIETLKGVALNVEFIIYSYYLPFISHYPVSSRAISIDMRGVYKGH
jgi:hypothetical protein